jgi:hypothetical protein
VDALRRILILHLLLSGLLSLQQPSVLVRNGPWLQATLDAQGASDEQLLEEEEKVPAVHSTYRVRRKACAPWRPDVLPARPMRSREAGVSPRGCDTAAAHWRAALLPSRSPLDDEPLEPA